MGIGYQTERVTWVITGQGFWLELYFRGNNPGCTVKKGWNGFQSFLFIPFGHFVWSWWIQNCSLRSLSDFDESLSGSSLSASIISHLKEFTEWSSLLKCKETGESLLCLAHVLVFTDFACQHIYHILGSAIAYIVFFIGSLSFCTFKIFTFVEYFQDWAISVVTDWFFPYCLNFVGCWGN